VTRKLATALAALPLFLCLFLAQGSAWAEKPRATKARADVNRGNEPNIASSSALVLDAHTGNVLYAKNAEQAVPIASITKIMTAIVVIDSGLPMDEPVALSSEDIDLIKGSKSRLPIGTQFRRDDLIRIALMASDNRAASALGRAYPGGTAAFVAAMNAKAQSLGMENTKFVDPAGLSPGNVSSPQDLGKLVAQASGYPLIREYSTTPAVDVTLPQNGRKIGFVNTNALVRSSDWNIGLSKTGYISEAGKCLVMKAMIANQPVVIVLLDSWGRLTRIGDANRIRRWLEKNPAKFAASPLRSG
jgi:D-alanyl-D-alanine endopeptidase (penicillin-binding protein 7)